MERAVHFLKRSYHSDPIAFYCEMVSFVLTVIASLTLALHANDPDMTIVYPGFFVGALFGIYGYYRRGIAWPMLLTAYFACVNVFGFGVAMLWW
jgi:hypothetical protein